jgi:hypothetical protein
MVEEFDRALLSSQSEKTQRDAIKSLLSSSGQLCILLFAVCDHEGLTLFLPHVVFLTGQNVVIPQPDGTSLDRSYQSVRCKGTCDTNLLSELRSDGSIVSCRVRGAANGSVGLEASKSSV